MKTELIDRIYECSIVPGLWPAVLDELAGLTDSKGGLLFSARDRVLNWTASANLNDIWMHPAGRSGVAAGNVTLDRSAAKN